ncbi:CheR family methyltransferase [Thiocapsa marina]|uniref:MCP methyltransferase, CheR-type n=1 Tax=Thiocapsa marina 5811 TaxID=768671 RepID=F9U751_9GAMM|nr:protein-glutamate O-methyltransferase CheR [Thiocapsa marina]EGV20077.1 MCP methyltransferase, CheR-type [Thiocapsa marina 5811]
MPIRSFKSFINDRLGLHFGPDADERLSSILASRMSATAAGSIEAYLQSAAADPVELGRLTGLLTVNETYFYREPAHLKLLVERLVPARMAQAAKGNPIRILSLGCSTGEEPYSIAIALRERYGELSEHLFRITAGDVDDAALERARAAVYGPFAFRALPAELRDRWFSRVDGTHRRVDGTIRRQVDFVSWNLAAPTYPTAIPGQDIIFFRNVSIYFDPATRKAVMTRLRDLLKPGGHLIVGTSETLANDFGLMRLRDLDGVFLFDKTPVEPTPGRASRGFVARSGTAVTTPASARDLRAGSTRPASTDRGDPGAIDPRPDTAGPIVPSGTPADPERYAQAMTSARSERFEEALRHLAPLCDRKEAAPEHLALQAHLLLERGDTAGAEAAARRVLTQDPWSSDALLLLGRCARLRGDTLGAINALRRVVYDTPSCWRAHYQLAETYRQRGETGAAEREYRIVLRQLQNETLAMQRAGALPSLLSVKDLRFLCETRLARLADAAA